MPHVPQDRKDDRVRVRCTEDTKVEFQEFLAGYTENEQALKDVLDVWRSYPSFFSRRKGRKSPD